MIEVQLFIPDEWLDVTYALKRKICGMPKDLNYQIKPKIGLELLLKLHDPDNRSSPVNALIRCLLKDSWTRAVIKEGFKRSIICDYAFLLTDEASNNLPDPKAWLVIRRSLYNPSIIKYYFSNALFNTQPVDLVRISGNCWSIETVFEKTEGEIGVYYYKMRS